MKAHWLKFNVGFYTILSLISLTIGNHLFGQTNDQKSPQAAPNPLTISIGFFPNITHAHALIAQNFARDGQGWFERYLPKHVQLKWVLFNAGPSAMESLLTHTLHLTYVGPSPALSLYSKTKGEEVRLLSGAVKGGSGLVIQPDLKIEKDQDWIGKHIASPQFGNTQDIACRAWFNQKGLHAGFSNQDVIILPTANPDQLLLFKKKEIAGAWTIEPWLSRLVQEENGKIYFLDQENWTTILVGTHTFCIQYPEIRAAFVQAHNELTQWIIEHPQEAAQRLQSELKQQTHLSFSLELILNSFKRLTFCHNITPDSLKLWIQLAKDSQIFKNTSIELNGDLTRLFQFVRPSLP